jgi:hypothetical protein
MMSGTRDEEARLNELRRRKAEEMIAEELRRRQRARTEQALLDSARPKAKKGLPDEKKDEKK